MSNVIAQFHKGKYVNKPIQLGTTLAKDVILEDGDSVDAKFRRLKCNSNGELSFKGKNVVRSVNGVNADEQGNVQLDGLVKSVNGVNADAEGNVSIISSGGSYGGYWVRLADGTQICYGFTSPNETTRQSATYPMPFIDKPFCAVASHSPNPQYASYDFNNSTNTTFISFTSDVYKSTFYIAIGKWK